jgi:hypothetical protein
VLVGSIVLSFSTGVWVCAKSGLLGDNLGTVLYLGGRVTWACSTRDDSCERVRSEVATVVVVYPFGV